MATAVIIPARNEARTIGKIVAAFNKHPETTGLVLVGIDLDTTDDTSRSVIGAGGTPIPTIVAGKGQVVVQCLHVLRKLSSQISHRIILCDGDYRGFQPEHVERILRPQHGMTIGVPDYPETDIPPEVRKAWPHVSGFRCLPASLVPDTAHGYLLETQLNLVAARIGVRVRHVSMPGLKSPFQWPLSETRQRELERDREWGKKNGIL